MSFKPDEIVRNVFESNNGKLFVLESGNYGCTFSYGPLSLCTDMGRKIESIETENATLRAERDGLRELVSQHIRTINGLREERDGWPRLIKCCHCMGKGTEPPPWGKVVLPPPPPPKRKV